MLSAPRARSFKVMDRGGDDVGEVVVSEVESVVGQLQGPQAACSPPKLLSWPAGHVVGQRPRAALPARLFTASKRQLVGAGAHVVPSWMLRNMMVTSSMRPCVQTGIGRDQGRPVYAGFRPSRLPLG